VEVHVDLRCVIGVEAGTGILGLKPDWAASHRWLGPGFRSVVTEGARYPECAQQLPVGLLGLMRGSGTAGYSARY